MTMRGWSQRWILSALCAAGLLPGLLLAAANPSLLDYSLKRLDEPSSESLGGHRGKPVLMLFFQPECNWCFKQVRVINALPGNCRESFTALAVGVNGGRSDLKRELQKLRPEFPAYQASPQLLSDLGGVPATPFALLGSADGAFHSWMRGYIPESKLRASLSALGATCG